MAEMDAKTMLIELRGKLDRAKAVYDMASARNVANLDAAARVDLDIAYQAAWLNFSCVEREYRNAIEKAIDLIGGPRALGQRLGVSRQAVNKWRQLKRLPRTDWTGETNYAEQIEALTGGVVTRNELLATLTRKDAA